MTFGSLFAGIGGLDLGLERAGMECRWQVEIDEYCRAVLKRHWPEVPKYGDIRQLTGSELAAVDLICGGYPCQPFSQAGKRGGADDPRHLWPEFARLLRILRPRYVLLENVPGHLSLGFGAVLGDLAGLGFDAEWTCLRASDFGASHLRKRVFIVAHRTTRGRRELRESSGRDGLIDGSNEDLGDSEHSGPSPAGATCELSAATDQPFGSGEMANAPLNARNGSQGQDGPRRGVCEASDELADSNFSHGGIVGRASDGRWENQERFGGVSSRLADPSNGQFSEPGRGPKGRDGAGSASAFAPGPGDPRWAAILRERPDLAPALESSERSRSTKAETEPTIRGMADGLPSVLDGALQDRTKRLKALGNAVVPQVAEWIGRRILGSI